MSEREKNSRELDTQIFFHAGKFMFFKLGKHVASTYSIPVYRSEELFKLENFPPRSAGEIEEVAVYLKIFLFDSFDCI